MYYQLLLMLCIAHSAYAMHKTETNVRYQSVGYLRQASNDRIPSLQLLAAQQLYKSGQLTVVDPSYHDITKKILADNVLHMRKDVAEQYKNQQLAAVRGGNNRLTSNQRVSAKIRAFNVLALIND
jgi:hypothetical protein